MLPFPSDTEALLFDCDGTLADTMTLHYAAWRETMAAHGVDLPREFIDKHAGVPTDLIVEDINNCWGVTLDPPAISEEKEDRFRLHIELVEPIEEVVATAQSYFGKLPMAVVSGGPVDVVTATLEQIDVLDLFPVLVTASDPVPPKPSPEVFLEGRSATRSRSHEVPCIRRWRSRHRCRQSRRHDLHRRAIGGRCPRSIVVPDGPAELLLRLVVPLIVVAMTSLEVEACTELTAGTTPPQPTNLGGVVSAEVDFLTQMAIGRKERGTRPAGNTWLGVFGTELELPRLGPAGGEEGVSRFAIQSPGGCRVVGETKDD